MQSLGRGAIEWWNPDRGMHINTPGLKQAQFWLFISMC